MYAKKRFVKLNCFPRSYCQDKNKFHVTLTKENVNEILDLQLKYCDNQKQLILLDQEIFKLMDGKQELKIEKVHDLLAAMNLMKESLDNQSLKKSDLTNILLGMNRLKMQMEFLQQEETISLMKLRISNKKDSVLNISLIITFVMCFISVFISLIILIS